MKISPVVGTLIILVTDEYRSRLSLNYSSSLNHDRPHGSGSREWTQRLQIPGFTCDRILILYRT
jgi:hypothetical protein